MARCATHMLGTIECRRCRFTGSVRVETIRKAATVERRYDCAACGYSGHCPMKVPQATRRLIVDAMETVAEQYERTAANRAALPSFSALCLRLSFHVPNRTPALAATALP